MGVNLCPINILVLWAFIRLFLGVFQIFITVVHPLRKLSFDFVFSFTSIETISKMTKLIKRKYSNMDQVWLALHFLELVTTLSALYYHIFGIINDTNEPLKHTMICCGISSTFLIYQVIDIARILTGGHYNFMFMMISEMLAASLFYITSIISMHHAEIDVHLEYMDNTQEDRHPFFLYSKAQSVSSLASSVFHLLHGCLMADAFLSYRDRPSKRLRDAESMGSSTLSYKTKIKRRMAITLPAQRPINLAVCHQRFELIEWIQQKVEKLLKSRAKSVVVLPSKFRKSGEKKSTGSGGSVRFTMGYM